MEKRLHGRFLRLLIDTATEQLVFDLLVGQIIPIEHRQQRREAALDRIAFRKRHQRAAAAAQRSGTLGGIFQMERISREYFGAGSVLVDILLEIDAEKFRQFFDGIKTGLEPEAALREAYGIGFKELAGLYGRRIGVPNLKP